MNFKKTGLTEKMKIQGAFFLALFFLVTVFFMIFAHTDTLSAAAESVAAELNEEAENSETLETHLSRDNQQQEEGVSLENNQQDDNPIGDYQLEEDQKGYNQQDDALPNVESSDTSSDNIPDTDNLEEELQPSIPMVEKHLFSPDADGENALVSKGIATSDDDNGPDDLLLKKIKQEIELTGIVISHESKKALVRYKKRGRKSEPASLYNSGDMIESYLLKDVFPNYIVVTHENRDIRLGLFQERTDRPEPLPEPVENLSEGTALPSQKNGESQGAQPVANGTKSGTSAGASSAQSNQQGLAPSSGTKPASANPFMKTIENAGNSDELPADNSAVMDGDGGQAPSQGINPFLQAIQRARERQQQQH
ncbi:exported hypothetical protein [Desulfamplus magnetovallimortis]|uniref:Type II secretion system protein GspC N-terminal domain-containing protein n=1 Tax=Desulfamplus magnetovallimortis TaxID=1246637 RepID=A0A1W1HD58_9BACT|nr:hypothetical protein [Desulfamplus magnetovallimortis]SLM30363.1 exported hypothetical protein [Desulfamplus magnetovallimortis]